MVYLDNAATTAMSEAAITALVDISSKQYGNPSAAYGFGRKTKEILKESRRIIAECIGAEPEEIYFTSCGTESDNWVIQQVRYGWSKLITSSIEHHAILHPAEVLESDNVNVIYLPVDNVCMVSEDALIRELNGSPVLVSIMMQNNETGAPLPPLPFFPYFRAREFPLKFPHIPLLPYTSSQVYFFLH